MLKPAEDMSATWPNISEGIWEIVSVQCRRTINLNLRCGEYLELFYLRVHLDLCTFGFWT